MDAAYGFARHVVETVIAVEQGIHTGQLLHGFVRQIEVEIETEGVMDLRIVHKMEQAELVGVGVGVAVPDVLIAVKEAFGEGALPVT